MKDSKYCQMTACCWGYRHELLGLILLIIASFLTILTCNSIGIAAMLLVGGLLCCYKHLSCHVPHGDGHCCHVNDDGSEMMALHKGVQQEAKKVVAKTKK